MSESTANRLDVPELLPARMVNEYVYCPRLFYLEWVQGEWRDNAETADGRFQHRRVDEETGKMPAPAGVEPGEELHARSLLLSSDAHRLIARIDLVETSGTKATPVDYKRGKAPEYGAAWDPDQVQICVQAFILRDKGWQVDEGIIYYVASKRRITIPITPELEAMTENAIANARRTAAAGVVPPPLRDSPKCPRCSLVGICMPDEVRHLAEAPPAATTSEDPESPFEVRRLFPARDDAQPVYVQEQGATVGKTGESLSIRTRDGKQDVRLLDVASLSVFGNVSISTQAVRELASRGIPISYFSYGGWFSAITTGMSHKNVELRRAQYRIAEDEAQSLAMATRFITAKILNQRTLIRRNHQDPPPVVLQEMRRLAHEARRVESAASLLGIEGMAARHYFQSFVGMLKGNATRTFDFEGRNRRPPKDPINALLSFGYAILAKDLAITLLAVGLDPYLGFFHRPRYGRPALALDLAEEFRPLIVDSVVLTVLNTGEIQATDFVTRGDAVALQEHGRRTFLQAYERRMDSLVRHPVLGYPASYRRTLEVQARLLSRHLLGEIPHYPPFRTR